MAAVESAAPAGALTLPRRRPGPRVDPSLLLPLLVAVVVAYLTVVPVVMQVWSSVQSSSASGGLTLDNYARVFRDPFARELLLTSFVFAVCSAMLGTAAGGLLAWFVERTDMPFRGL